MKLKQQDILFGKTLSELEGFAKKGGMPDYTARQIAEWLYKKHVYDFDRMSNISKANRQYLKENYEVGTQGFLKVRASTDGTKKYLFRSRTHGFIETAYIPEENRNTLCVSSQVGCKMGCLFCMTAQQGFQANLSSNEILNQLVSIPESGQVSNIVYMGMGEPFDNLDEVMKSLEILTNEQWGLGTSPKKVTVSTIGIIPGIQRFLAESGANLAISLHSPFEEERSKIMPIQHIYTAKQIMKVLRGQDVYKQRRISFEYIMFKDFNDTARHVNALAALLNGIKCRINLIRFHSFPGAHLEGSDDDKIETFQALLKAKGIMTTIRKSRGQDIEAACGMLSTKELSGK